MFVNNLNAVVAAFINHYVRLGSEDVMEDCVWCALDIWLSEEAIWLTISVAPALTKRKDICMYSNVYSHFFTFHPDED